MLARHDNPEFVPSLRLLVCREEYSLTDIGLIFGVSRERVRQWCVKYRIEHPAGRLGPMTGHGQTFRRMWDSSSNRFRPIRVRDINRARQERKTAARIDDLRARQSVRRERIIRTVRNLAATLGRPPGVQELGRALTHGRKPEHQLAPIIVGMWGSVRGPRKLRQIENEIERLTGIRIGKYRMRGAPRVNPNRLKPFCPNGHDMAVTPRYPSGGCVACAKERGRRQSAERMAAYRASLT